MQVEGFRAPAAPPRVRVFGADDLHLTLCFFGAVQESAAQRAWQELERFEAMRLVEGTFGEVRALEHAKKPSAVAANVADGREAFSAMILEARAPLLAEAGARPDDRTPLPHMTIARVQRRADGAERQAAHGWMSAIDLGGARFRASEVALYTWSSDRQTRLFDVVERRPMCA